MVDNFISYRRLAGTPAGHFSLNWRLLVLSLYIFWISFVRSSELIEHRSLASHWSLANSDGSVLSGCRKDSSGLLFQVSRQETSYLTWSASPLCNRCISEAMFILNVSRNISSSFASPQYRKGSTILSILDWFLGFSGRWVAWLRSSPEGILVLSFFHFACCSDRSFSSTWLCSCISCWSSSVIFDMMSSRLRLSSVSGRVESTSSSLSGSRASLWTCVSTESCNYENCRKCFPQVQRWSVGSFISDRSHSETLPIAFGVFAVLQASMVREL